MSKFGYEAFNEPHVYDGAVRMVAHSIEKGHDVEVLQIEIGPELDEKEALALAKWMQETANEEVARLKKRGELL